MKQNNQFALWERQNLSSSSHKHQFAVETGKDSESPQRVRGIWETGSENAGSRSPKGVGRGKSERVRR